MIVSVRGRVQEVPGAFLFLFPARHFAGASQSCRVFPRKFPQNMVEQYSSIELFYLKLSQFSKYSLTFKVRLRKTSSIGQRLSEVDQ